MKLCDKFWRNQAQSEIVVAAMKVLSTLLGRSEGDKQVWLYVLSRHWTFLYIPSCTKWREVREGGREGEKEGGKEGGREERREIERGGICKLGNRYQAT